MTELKIGNKKWDVSLPTKEFLENRKKIQEQCDKNGYQIEFPEPYEYLNKEFSNRGEFDKEIVKIKKEYSKWENLDPPMGTIVGCSGNILLVIIMNPKIIVGDKVWIYNNREYCQGKVISARYFGSIPHYIVELDNNEEYTGYFMAKTKKELEKLIDKFNLWQNFLYTLHND